MKFYYWILIAIQLGVFPFVNAGRANQNQATSAPAAQSTASDAQNDYVIGLEDILSIFVWREPDLSVKEVMVRPDGKISLPLVSDIQASGLTPRRLQEQITEKLKDFISTPNVTVVITKIASRTVSIVGKVLKPGAYSLISPITVLELLARAGGFQEDANLKRIKIHRAINGQSFFYSFNYKEVIEGKNIQQNIVLKYGDVVMVP